MGTSEKVKKLTTDKSFAIDIMLLVQRPDGTERE